MDESKLKLCPRCGRLPYKMLNGDGAFTPACACSKRELQAEIDRLKAELAETKGVCKYLVEAIEELPITTQYNTIGAEVMDTWLPIMKAMLDASPEYRP